MRFFLTNANLFIVIVVIIFFLFQFDIIFFISFLGFTITEHCESSESEEVVLNITTNSFVNNYHLQKTSLFSVENNSSLSSNEQDIKNGHSDSYFALHKGVIDELPPPLEEDEDDKLNKSKGSESLEDNLSSQFPLISFDNIDSLKFQQEAINIDNNSVLGLTNNSKLEVAVSETVQSDHVSIQSESQTLHSQNNIKITENNAENSMFSNTEQPINLPYDVSESNCIAVNKSVDSSSLSEVESNCSEDMKKNEDNKSDIIEKILCLIGAVLPINRNVRISSLIYFSFQVQK